MRKQTKIWTCKDGTRLRICDMEDSHLDNAIRLIERMAEARTGELVTSGYQALGCLQGEMALDSIERELGYLEQYGLEPSEINPLYDNLILEKQRREILNEDFGGNESKCWKCQQKAVLNGVRWRLWRGAGMSLFENKPPTIHKPDLTGMIPITDCLKGRLYKIRARNFQLGVYNGTGGFIGRRNKFGSWYLFTEFHYDIGAPHGTVFPTADTGIDLPEGVEIKDEGNPRLAAFLREHAYLIEE